MSKLLILSFLLYSLSGFSQTITLVNNTSDVIVIDQLWLNEFCSYNFPGVQPQVPATPLVTTLIGPSSAAVIFTITGPGMLSAIPYDFEYIKLNVMQIIGGTLGAPLPLSDLGTEPTVYYNPASCDPLLRPLPLLCHCLR